jgi:hypothetical protein
MSGTLRRGGIGVLLVGMLVSVTGCLDGARFARLDDQGGVVIYPLKKERESIYAGRFRADALKMIEEHCHGSYLIVREGETASQTSNLGLDSEDLLTTRRFWGLQFKCKEGNEEPQIKNKRGSS